MRAFVLSGGANYGALQVGALQVLLEHEIYPDMLVGASAGALNAAWFTRQPTLEGLRQLERVWRTQAPALYHQPGGVLLLLRLVQGQDGLLTSQALQRLIAKTIPPQATFGEIVKPRLYVVAVRLSDGWLRAFGDRCDDGLMDALMASTALPPLFPPWCVDGESYVDGGVLSNLPLQVAIDRGAEEIYALDITQPVGELGKYLPHGILTTAAQSVLLMHDHQIQVEIDRVRENHRVRLHYLSLYPNRDPGFWEFSQAVELVADGRRLTQTYLEEQSADVKRPLTWLQRLRRVFSPEPFIKSRSESNKTNNSRGLDNRLS